jgi:hypothetical protein
MRKTHVNCRKNCSHSASTATPSIFREPKSLGPSLSLHVAQRSSSTVVTRPSEAAVAFLFGPNASPWRSVFRPPLTVPPCVTRHTVTTQIHSPLRSPDTTADAPHFFPPIPAVVCAFKFAHSVQNHLTNETLLKMPMKYGKIAIEEAWQLPERTFFG